MGNPKPGPVGEQLRDWRAARGLSQLALSCTADVSCRHISFLETGRSSPSREMVLRLAEALELPLRDRNRLLHAAGFAAQYGETSLRDSELALARHALQSVLSAHEPYPAFVVDRCWNVLLANAAHAWLLDALLPGFDPDGPVNVMRLVLDPELLRPQVVNWTEVAHVLGHRIQRALRTPIADADARSSLEQLLELPGVHAAMARFEASAESEIVLPLVLAVNGEELAWFSTIAAIGTPRDITLDELSIESLFPADHKTKAWIEKQGKNPGKRSR